MFRPERLTVLTMEYCLFSLQVAARLTQLFMLMTGESVTLDLHDLNGVFLYLLYM